MSVFTLGDICEVTAGQSAPQDPSIFGVKGKPFIRAGSLEKLLNGGVERDCELIPDENAIRQRLRLFPEDTILFAKSGMSAKIGRVYRLRTPSYVVSHLAAVMPGPKVDPSYLQRWFEKHPPSRLIPNEAYPSIRTSEISQLKIDLPPLAEQKRIAAILDKADATRRKRQQAIKLADDFLRATFLDIFGDPKASKGDRPMIELGKIAQIIMGQSPAGESYNGTGEGVPLLNGPVEFGKKYPKEKQWTNKPTKYSNAGDILFCVRGATAGRMNWADKQYCLGRGLAAIRGKGEISNHFIYKFLEFMYPYFQSTSDGSTFINIPSNVLNTLLMPNPMEEEEVKFTSLSKWVEKYKEHCEVSLGKAEDLFNSLTQRAFRGEL